MPRPALHDTDTMLDAARDLLLGQGARAATVEAIAQTSGAPSGTIYHRFGSRDELVARLWIRGVQRSQAAFFAVTEGLPPRDAVLAGGLSILDFCAAEPADAQLLVAFRHDDLVRAAPTGALAEELEQLNRPVERAVVDLARGLYGRASRAALDRVLLAVFDLPYGAVRRHMIAREPLPRGLRGDLARAIAAVVDQGP
ncbi:MAG TPA: helix-turn-helix domain-containing protein [Thermoleophilaceae bacterium]|nr:helix-turn-helix domain-containing protein [Thermoleophilaceae bacterium]